MHRLLHLLILAYLPLAARHLPVATGAAQAAAQGERRASYLRA